jgi:SAM-dependent methyltransferase
MSFRLADCFPSLISRDVTSTLDYGCGGSPYRSLFRHCKYHRRRLSGRTQSDFEYSADALLPSELRDYDFILSIQVLEHVEDPTNYLQDCYRVLKPGAHFLLTTHGLFEDHACRYDYWRWIAFGLRRLVEDNVKEIKKVTTGPPGGTFCLSEREFGRLRFRASGFYGHCLSVGIRTVKRRGTRRLHEATDKSFPHCRVVDASESGHDVYVVIALLAAQLSD